MSEKEKESKNRPAPEDVNIEKRKFLKQSASLTILAALGSNLKAATLDAQQNGKFNIIPKEGFEIYYPGAGNEAKSLNDPALFQPYLLQQVEIITKAVSTRKGRAEFISDPYKYAAKFGVELDPILAERISNELLDAENRAAALGQTNNKLSANVITCSN